MAGSDHRNRSERVSPAAAARITVRPRHHTHAVICPLTGLPHRLFWMRSSLWCHDCRQKIESCCEGGGCTSVVEHPVSDELYAVDRKPEQSTRIQLMRPSRSV
jgi:hypothetical protein